MALMTLRLKGEIKRMDYMPTNDRMPPLSVMKSVVVSWWDSVSCLLLK